MNDAEESMKVKWLAVFMMTCGALMAQNKIGVTLGGHYWLTMMDYQIPFNVDVGGEGRVDVSTSHMFGPTLDLRFGGLHIQGSYTMGSFDFAAIGIFDRWISQYDDKDNQYYDMIRAVYPEADDGTDYALRIENWATRLDRNELNALVGYMLSSNLLLFGAYKNIRYNWHETDINYTLFEYVENPDPFGNGTIEPVNGTEAASRFTTPYSRKLNMHYFGPGLKLVLPFGDLPIGFDATAVYYFPAEKKDSEITSLLGSLTFHAPFGLSLSLGYHAQLRSLPNSGDYEKTTHGPFVQVLFTFGFLSD